jgi:uncharacterized protein (UPF0305 family)
MNTNIQLTKINNTIKPPLSKKEMIEATVIATFNKQLQAHKEWDEKHKAITAEKRKELLEAVLNKLNKSSAFIQYYDKFSVCIKVEFDSTLIDEKYAKKFDTLTKVMHPDINTIRRDINAISKNPIDYNRIKLLLEDETINKKFVKAGEALLGKAEDIRASANSINI